MLNPLRDVVERLGRQAAGSPSPFRAEADDVLAGFRASKKAIEARVRSGDLTPKVAREQAGALAAGVGRALRHRADEFSAVPRAFLDRLVEASERRKVAADHAPIETLQRETNRLLRSVLVEQQIAVRREEFEARAFVRPVAGGRPAPTIESLLNFHEAAGLGGDDAAAEWARRQLEAIRPLVSSPDDHRRIDRATDRPDRVNPRLVAAYVAAMADGDPEGLERFVAESVASRDANACMAAFVLAREAPEGSRLRWVRMVLDGVADFPDVAIATLRELEASTRADDREAAVTQAEFVRAQAETEARLPGLEAPSDEEAARRSSLEGRPMARPGEAIGLALGRRGAFEGEDPAGVVEDNRVG